MLHRYLPALALALAMTPATGPAAAAGSETAEPIVLAAAPSKKDMPDLPPPPQTLTKEELDSLPPPESSTRKPFATPAGRADERTPAEKAAPAKR